MGSKVEEEEEERRLNAFETLLASCNVRFALLVVVPSFVEAGECLPDHPGGGGGDLRNQDVTTSQLAKLKDGAVKAIQSSRLGHLQLVHRTGQGSATANDDDGDDDVQGEWYLSAYRPGEDPDAMVGSRPDVCLPCPADFGRYLDDRVHGGPPAPAPSAGGPLQVEVVRFVANDGGRGTAVAGKGDNTAASAPPAAAAAPLLGLLVNGSHAMCDGRALLHFVGVALQQIQPSPMWTTTTTTTSSVIVPEDWKNLVQASSATKDWNDVPPYLGAAMLADREAGKTDLLTLQELSSLATDLSVAGLRSETQRDGIHSSRTLRYVTPPNVMGNAKALLRRVAAESQQKISFTGLLAALIMESIVAEYHGRNGRGQEPLPSREIGVSVLVDLRPFLKNQAIPELPQAIGTVTLLLMTSEFLEPLQEDSPGPLLRQAERLTAQLQGRIQRGEAHRSASALTNGNFDGASPPATVELSNLGVCPLPTSTAKLFTAQRFDGYDGVSCIVHSETTSNCDEDDATMRWSVSVGDGLDEGLVDRIFSQVVARLEATANTASPFEATM